MAGKNPLYPIPHPARKPFVGNILSIGSESPVLDMWKIAQDLGEIYWLDMPGMPVIVVSSAALRQEHQGHAATAACALARAVHLRHPRVDLVEAAQHPPGQLQPARDAGLPAALLPGTDHPLQGDDPERQGRVAGRLRMELRCPRRTANHSGSGPASDTIR